MLLTEVFAVLLVFPTFDQFHTVLADSYSLSTDGQLHHNTSVVWIEAFDLPHSKH